MISIACDNNGGGNNSNNNNNKNDIDYDLASSYIISASASSILEVLMSSKYRNMC